MSNWKGSDETPQKRCIKSNRIPKTSIEAESGGAIHAAYDMFNEDDNETVLMVDVSNTFNSINREVPHHRTKVLCPALATFIDNCSPCSRR